MSSSVERLQMLKEEEEEEEDSLFLNNDVVPVFVYSKTCFSVCVYLCVPGYV